MMKASCLTHGHPRSQLACAFYAELVSMLLNGVGFRDALEQTQRIYRPLIENHYPSEADRFERVLSPGLARIKAREISGSGYVIHCLEASLWCCCQTGSYEEAVLAAVNLGSDTDTTGSVTGGLAALLYGKDAVPDRWVAKLAKHNDVLALYERFATACAEHWKECASRPA
ncbi:MAG: ADP-ribosylglycohydrolase family protein [Phycisphaerales bacterium]